MGKSRRQYTAAQKAAILREHLIDRVSVADLCERQALQPTQFYRWQKEMMENLVGLFERQRGESKTTAPTMPSTARSLLLWRNTGRPTVRFPSPAPSARSAAPHSAAARDCQAFRQRCCSCPRLGSPPCRGGRFFELNSEISQNAVRVDDIDLDVALFAKP
jgi:transposase